jgi:hypothetical protein
MLDDARAIQATELIARLAPNKSAKRPMPIGQDKTQMPLESIVPKEVARDFGCATSLIAVSNVEHYKGSAGAKKRHIDLLSNLILDLQIEVRLPRVV